MQGVDEKRRLSHRPSLRWPRPIEIADMLGRHGFYTGSEDRNEQTLLAHISHGISYQELTKLPQNIDTLKACAECLLAFLGIDDSLLETSQTIPLANGILIGPAQQRLLDLFATVQYQPQVLSGYRSTAFQALLFACRYLNGKLLDADGRYTTAPPGFSDHHILDHALDVGDSILFALHAIKLQEDVPISLIQPYLFHPDVAHEPWHWRCIHSPEGAPVRKEPYYKTSANLDDEHLDYLIEYFSKNHQTQKEQTEHIFVAGQSRSGATVCVGSRQKTFDDSLADALEAVGQGWDSYYIIISEGYTPILNNSILSQDVGRFNFKSVVSENRSHTYLTAQSCCVKKINTPSKILNTLKRKGKYLKGTTYELFKSRTRELVYLRSGVIIPCSYGLPLSTLERPILAPKLLIEEYTNWLIHASQDHLPIYYSRDYGRTYSEERDYTRYAYMLLVLSKYRAALSPEIQGLITRLFNTFFEGHSWQQISAGKSLQGDVTPESTAVFLTHALVMLGDADMAYGLWEANSKQILAKMWAICTQDVESNPIALGHFCDLLDSMPLIDINVLPHYGFTERTVEGIVQIANRRLTYALAASQVLKIATRADWHFETTRLIEQMLEHLLGYPSSPVPEERYAFLGLESFLTSLPLEALQNLAPLISLADNDMALIHHRIDGGLQFLRKLQFQHGAGFMTPHPHLLEGAVRYSLLDHHFRMDYGLHAISVALQAQASQGEG